MAHSAINIEIISKNSKKIHPYEEQLKSVIIDAIKTHPFITEAGDSLKELLVYLDISNNKNTCINHDSYLLDNTIELTIDDLSLNSTDIKDQLKRDIYHEIAHFIDARISKTFGYHEKEVPKEKSRLVYYHLWNCYIDGRLGSLAPRTLEQRIIEGQDCINLKPCYSINAWNGDYNNFSKLIEVVKTIRTVRDVVPRQR